MAAAGRSAGLQTIFSFFLGLMVTTFVGVGVYTFHPPPQREINRQVENLARRERAIINSGSPGEPTPADRAQIEEFENQRTELLDAAQTAREAWGRSTSIVLIVLATLVMIVSLVRADHLPVISNGLLLGGVFTMVYGVGWIVASDTSVTRFVVVTVALVTTVVFGYLRFVHRKPIPLTAGGPEASQDEGLLSVQQRLRDLEDRMDEAANVLGRKGDRPKGP